MTLDELLAFARAQNKLPILEDIAGTPDDAVALSVLGGAKGFETLPSRRQVIHLALRNVGQRHLDIVARMPSLESLSIFIYSGTSLAPLAMLARLRSLSVGAASKIETLDEIGGLSRLEALGIHDMSRINDLCPIARLTRLKVLAIGGSFTKAQRLRSLEPLSALGNLDRLSLDGVRVENDDLRPIARMRHLQHLQLGRGFLVREYARLSVALSHLQCEAFAPTSHIEHKTWDPAQNKAVHDPSLGETILIARPIKMVSAAEPKGAALIAKRIAEHERWQAHYRSVADPAADELKELPALPKPTRPKRKLQTPT